MLWLQQRAGLSADEIAESLEHRSGLLGLGGSSDMAELLAAADRGDARAGLAIDVYVHRLVAGIAAMTAALGGLDALVFTGGVGEHAPAIRLAAAQRLAFLGVRMDVALNAGRREDADVSAAGTSVRTLVVEAREDLEIVRGVQAVLGLTDASQPP